MFRILNINFEKFVRDNSRIMNYKERKFLLKRDSLKITGRKFILNKKIRKIDNKNQHKKVKVR